MWVRCEASRPGNITVWGWVSDGSEGRILTRERFECGDAFGTNGVDRATQFLNAAAEPLQFILGDAVVLRIAGLHIGLFQFLKAPPILASFTRPSVDQPHIKPLSLGAKESEVVDVRSVERANQQNAVVKPLRRLMHQEGR